MEWGMWGKIDKNMECGEIEKMVYNLFSPPVTRQKNASPF